VTPQLEVRPLQLLKIASKCTKKLHFHSKKSKNFLGKGHSFFSNLFPDKKKTLFPTLNPSCSPISRSWLRHWVSGYCCATNHWTLVSQNTCQFCLVTIHRHVNSDHPTTNCCPSQQTTQCSPAVRSAQLHLVFGTVYQLPFEQHPLPTLFDDTSRLIFSPATPPSTNCYYPRLRFELLFWHMARYKCRLLT